LEPEFRFEGAQLVDSENLCLTRGENPTQDPDGNDEFVIYVDECVDSLGDPENAENIDRLKRQTWIIENTQFTDTQFIIRATCEEKAIKRFMDKRTYQHSSQTICNQCRLQHYDAYLVDLDQCVGDNIYGRNECYNFLNNLGPQ
jgi:hypothetical protein